MQKKIELLLNYWLWSITWRFFCDLNISPPGYVLLKNKKISLEKLPWICTKKSQKAKVIPLNKKSPQHTYPRSVKKQSQFLWTKNPPPPAYVPQICRLLLLICQRKFIQKIWKFSLKIFFLEKTYFWGTKKGVFRGGGRNSQEKMFWSQKKR